MQDKRVFVANSGFWHIDSWSWKLNFIVGQLSEATIAEWEMLQNILRSVNLLPAATGVFIWWHEPNRSL